MVQVLHSTAQIRDEIGKLMAPGTRRVAVVAFVGAGATVYIPKPKNATIVCWPKAGGTTPAAVRDFIRRGAEMKFADRVHMKVFWAKGRGAIVGSANLSTNALGAGGLRELAVRLSASEVDIDGILKSVSPRPVTEAELKKLEAEHEGVIWTPSSQWSGGTLTFSQWMTQAKRARWKIGWWDEHVPFSRKAKAEARALLATCRASIVGRKGDYEEGDWVLMFGLRKKTITKPTWLYVNFVVKASASSKTDYPYEAVQTFTDKQCPPPPFRLDNVFCAAWKTACGHFAIEKIREWDDVKAPQRLLRLAHEHAERS